MGKFIYRPTKNAKQYGSKKRNLSDIKFIVIHDTGNTNRGAGALGHLNYLDGATRYGSAHYYVDDKIIAQPIGDSRVAWSVGDTWARKNRTRTDVNNSNSISIEMCINADSDYNAMYKNVVELTKNLMQKYNIPLDRVVRHYDASGKPCPNHMMAGNWAKWKRFLYDIDKPIEWVIDLDKNSEFGGVKVQEVKLDDNSPSEWAKESVERLVKAGVSDGLRLKEPITREEVLVMIDRALKL